MVEAVRFDPKNINRVQADEESIAPDRRDGAVYVYDRENQIRLAVNAALATGRSLLLSGPSGSGKSSLAFNVAASLKRRCYTQVVTSKSEARDLLYHWDAVRRLNDAHTRDSQMKHDQAYVEPGALWWAFDKESAEQRGRHGHLSAAELAKDPSPLPGDEAVVLIDEIDKADPDLPNALLVALGSFELEVEPIRFPVKAKSRPLVIITTNGERDLPSTLVRRCICLDLPAPDADRLVEIAKATLARRFDEKLCRAVAVWLVSEASNGKYPSYARPSTAEYLDTIHVCLEEKIGADDPRFKDVVSLTVKKAAVRVA